MKKNQFEKRLNVFRVQWEANGGTRWTLRAARKAERESLEANGQPLTQEAIMFPEQRVFVEWPDGPRTLTPAAIIMAAKDTIADNKLVAAQIRLDAEALPLGEAIRIVNKYGVLSCTASIDPKNAWQFKNVGGYWKD